MRVVVTGGAGFIGSHTVEELVHNGAQVVVIDNFRSGALENLAGWAEKIEIIPADVLETLSQNTLGSVDAIVHLAAIPSVQESLEHPFETHKANYETTLAVAEYARRNSVKRVVFASSAAVYGSNADFPLTEETLTHPISHYGVDKLSSENILSVYRDLYGIECTSCRFFNVYGPRQNPNSPYSGVISIFLEAAKQGKSIRIFGDGLQTRDFVFVKDIAKVISRAIFSPEAPPKVMNVATANPTTLLDVVSALGAGLQQDINVEFEHSRTGDIRHSIGSCDRLSSWLGDWHPVGIQEGITSLFD